MNPAALTLVETSRKRRGHAFLPPKAVLRRIPTIEQYGDPDCPGKFHIKYFSPSLTWFVSALDEDGTAYGYVVNLADPMSSEWGCFSLVELEAVYVPPFGIVERDMHFEPADSDETLRTYMSRYTRYL